MPSSQNGILTCANFLGIDSKKVIGGRELNSNSVAILNQMMTSKLQNQTLVVNETYERIKKLIAEKFASKRNPG